MCSVLKIILKLIAVCRGKDRIKYFCVSARNYFSSLMLRVLCAILSRGEINYFSSARRLICVRCSATSKAGAQTEDSISVSIGATQCYANANTFS